MKSNEGKFSFKRKSKPYDKWFENNMFPSEMELPSFVDITDRKK
jgi:hypothetical protein